MSTVSFDISTFTGDPASVRITLAEVAGGKIEVTVGTIGGTIADLQGLFFNLSNESQTFLNSLTVSGPDVTGSLFKTNQASNLGDGVNMNGTKTAFDGGVKIGTSGIGKDDISSTTFVLSHASVALTLGLFENQNFGVRLTSVGANRNGSSKLVGNVGDINFPPDAVNDSATTDEDTPVTTTVLTNDTDPDGDTLTVTGATNGANGATTVNPDGTITYTPNANFNGTDSYTYTISDGNGGTDTATVTVTIDPVNDPPDAVNDSATVELGDSVVINVVNNDSDTDGTINPSSTQLVSNPTPGDSTITNNTNGTFTYNSTITNNPGPLSQADDSFVDTFTYTVDDNDGLSSNEATVTVNVIDPGEQTNSTSGTLNPGQENEQDVLIGLTTEEQTANDSTFVKARITLPSLLQPNFNIAYVIDISGSTDSSFGGTPVGNQNGDSLSNTILDAEIASFKSLTQSLLGTGFGNDEIDIGLISFSGTATLQGAYEPANPTNPTQINSSLSSKLSSLRFGGTTNFDDALDKAIDFFNAQPDKATATNILYFLSDGLPNVSGDGDPSSEGPPNENVANNSPRATAFGSELAILDGLNVTRVAVGVGAGSNVSLGSGLAKIDNTGGAQQVLSSDELTGALLGNPIVGATLTNFELLVDGINVNGNFTITGTGDLDNNGLITKDDLTSSPLGFDLGLIELGGLNPTVDNTITARATFDDGTTLFVDNVIAGALPVI